MKKIDQINATIRLLNISKKNIVIVFFLSIFNAISEGLGIAFLLPILKFMELGADGFAKSDSLILKAIVWCVEFIRMPLVFSTILFVCFVPIVVKQVFFYMYQSYVVWLKNSVIAHLQSTIFKKTISADIAYLEEEGAGKFLSAMTLEAERTGNTLLLIFQLSWSVVLLTTLFTVLLFLSWQLTMIAGVVFLVVELIIHKQMGIVNQFGERMSVLNENLAKFLSERTSGLRLIKLVNTEKPEIERMDTITSQIAEQQSKIQASITMVQAFIEPALAVGAFLILYFAVSSFGMSLSSLGLYLFILTRMLPVAKMSNGYRQQIQSCTPVFKLLKGMVEKSEQRRTIVSGTRNEFQLNKSIDIQNLSFSYGVHTPALKNVSFSIPANKITALVGYSGSGKSTIVDLLVRLRQAQSGNILIDGVNISDFELGVLRRNIGVVSQNNFLFNASVHDNLSYGSEPQHREVVRQAAEKCFADAFIDKLPMNYDSVLSDRGDSLSGGERQRLCFARTLVANPSVLILDEPTSALDAKSEQFLLQTIGKMRGTKTIIFITHRLSSTRDVDHVIVLREGEVVEQGTPNSLMHNTQSIYRNLLLQQPSHVEA